jgi:hypothetical protein
MSPLVKLTLLLLFTTLVNGQVYYDGADLRTSTNKFVKCAIMHNGETRDILYPVPEGASVVYRDCIKNAHQLLQKGLSVGVDADGAYVEFWDYQNEGCTGTTSSFQISGKSNDLWFALYEYRVHCVVSTT